MATKLSKTTLKELFSDGERPTGDHFESAWMSFLNQTDDQISYNGTNNNIELGPNTGLVLGNPTVGVTPGTLRFNSGTATVQFHDGGGFKDIAGNAGAFVPVGGGPAVAFSGGNVGIGTAAATPDHRLEIPLGANTNAGQEVLLGNLVVHNGTANDGAYLANNNLALDNTGYALFQDALGNTTINSASGGNLAISVGTTNVLNIATVGLPSLPFLISMDGSLQIGKDGAGNSRSLTVWGNAAKSGNLLWTLATGSDARIKKDVREYKEGLDKVISLRPVTYKLNGKGGTIDDGKDYIGFIAQDVQKAAPELVFSQPVKLNREDEEETEILNYDFHNVLFMFINAFKELNAKVEKLEKAQKNEKRKAGSAS